MSGECVLKGTRMPVSAIFENLEAGANIDDIMEWCDGLDREQVKAVIEFAARSLDKEPLTRCGANHFRSITAGAIQAYAKVTRSTAAQQDWDEFKEWPLSFGKRPDWRFSSDKGVSLELAGESKWFRRSNGRCFGQFSRHRSSECLRIGSYAAGDHFPDPGGEGFAFGFHLQVGAGASDGGFDFRAGADDAGV